MPVNLVPLDNVDFNVILGMDWLDYNHTMLNCHQKIVTFHRPGMPMVTFIGELNGLKLGLISAIRVKQMLRKGCQGYLAHVVVIEDTFARVEDVLVVIYFPDVFPNDLPGLPPDHEVEFTIDLIPSIDPISLTPFVIVFINNNLAYSKSEADHAKHLRLVLKKLRENQVYAKFSKCQFWLDQVSFLGHMISTQGVLVDPCKVVAVENWKQRQIVTEVQSFHGLLKYYLTHAPVLALPNENGNFKICSDTSLNGLGCMLMQHGKVKAERKKPFELLQPLPIPQWQWEDIIMDFVFKLPRTQNGYDSIWVIVDRLNKSAHFLPVRENYSLSQLVELFVSEIVKYQGVPPLEINPYWTYDKVPVTILDSKDKVLKNKTIRMVKVLWTNHYVKEATEETEQHNEA
ncbi:uncharacterized protein [Pyrus communis]|uniref:uncharacterized protein n=1 Tax=Pyrus communis TaxID=23211 RepID=UPI0035C048FA